jgi:hypothetical protein
MRSFVNRGSASHQQRTARRSSPTTHSKALTGGPIADGQDRVREASVSQSTQFERLAASE